MDSDERVALVTGGAKRVGRAIVEHLARAGFAVVFTYLNSKTEADELARGPNVHPIQADLTQPQEAVTHIVGALARFTDHVDVLVHNASIYEPGGLETAELAQARRM